MNDEVRQLIETVADNKELGNLIRIYYNKLIEEEKEYVSTSTFNQLEFEFKYKEKK
jgi:hypothetical protein